MDLPTNPSGSLLTTATRAIASIRLPVHCRPSTHFRPRYARNRNGAELQKSVGEWHLGWKRLPESRATLAAAPDFVLAHLADCGMHLVLVCALSPGQLSEEIGSLRESGHKIPRCE